MQNIIIKSWISKKIKFTYGIIKWTKITIKIKIRLLTLKKITKIK